MLTLISVKQKITKNISKYSSEAQAAIYAAKTEAAIRKLYDYMVTGKVSK